MTPVQKQRPDRDPPGPGSSEAAWLGTIDLDGTLHASVVRLLRTAADPDGLIEAADGLFCGVLGYTRDRLDISDRVATHDVPTVVRIARFDAFVLSAAILSPRLAGSWFAVYSSRYRHIFDVQREGLVLAVEPGSGVLRLVYRIGDKLRWRCLRGPLRWRDAAENAATVSFRFHAIRPGIHDDPRSLVRKAADAFDPPVSALAPRWNSAPFPRTADPPGLPIDAGLEDPVAWLTRRREGWGGLDAALRQALPFHVHGIGVLRLLDLRVVEPPIPPEDARRHARTRQAIIAIDLEFEPIAGPRDGFTLSAALPLPDDRGWWWLDGEPLRLVPRVDPDGRPVLQLVDRPHEDQSVAEEDPTDDGSLAQEDPQDDDFAENAPPDIEPPDIEPPDIEPPDIETSAPPVDDEPGAGPGPGQQGAQPSGEARPHWRSPPPVSWDGLLLHLVERSLTRLLLRCFRHLRATGAPVDAEAVVRGLRFGVPPGDPVPLVNPRRLHRVLEPVDPAWPPNWAMAARADQDALPRSLPAWACGPTSWDLPPGAFAASSGARRHPCGGWAAPHPVDGHLVLAACDRGPPHPEVPRSLRVHPAIAGADPERPLAGAAWIVGVHDGGRDLCGRGRAWRPQPALRGPAWHEVHVPPGAQVHVTRLQQRVDVPGCWQAEPLVGPGDILHPGRAWLRVATEPEPTGAMRRRFLELVDPDGIARGEAILSPYADAVRVVGVESIRLPGRLGHRFWLTVLPLGVAVLDPGGQALHRVRGRADPADLPWNLAPWNLAVGDRRERGRLVAVPGPAPSSPPSPDSHSTWIDGRTGAALLDARPTDVFLLAAPLAP
ncbi:MAG: hypothetical protein D6798_19950, partial [Deltaproteobacteria bacterium]